MKKQKIFVLHTECVYTRGGEKYIFEIFRRLSKKYLISMYLQDVSPEWKRQYKQNGILVKKIWKPKRLYWLMIPITILVNYFRLRQIIKKNDVIYATNFPLNLLSILLSNKTICHCFEPLPIFYDSIRIASLPKFSKMCVIVAKHLYAFFDKKAIQNCTILTTLNPSLDKYIFSTYNRKPDIYIPNGVDTKFFTMKKFTNPSIKNGTCLTIGHSTDFTIFKGTEYFIKTIPLISNKIKNIKIYISESIHNPKIRKTYEQFLRMHNCFDHVEFLGNVTEKLMPKFYQSLDVFCFLGPPRCPASSTASLSVLEAQSCGVPVMRSEGNNFEILNGKTGFFVNPDNLYQTAKTIISFLQLSEKKRKTIGKNAKKYVETNFSWDISVKKLSDVINRLTAKL